MVPVGFFNRKIDSILARLQLVKMAARAPPAPALAL